MPDIRLVEVASPDVMTLDWLQTPTGLIDETNELVTGILVALGSDAAAAPSDVLPDPRSDDRRGWWGDLDAARIWNGWPLGSKLWLMTRAKILDAAAREGATTTRARSYILACLQPFVTYGIASKITVDASQTTIQRISAGIIVYRGPKSAIQLQYQALWDDLFNPPVAVKTPLPPPQTTRPGPMNFSVPGTVAITAAIP